MVILLAGTSDIGRSTIAHAVVSGKQDWRHLPMENLVEAVALQKIDLTEDESVLAKIASHCAEELFEDGFHLVLSLSNINQMSPIRDAMESECLTVVLGDEGADVDADCVIDTTTHSAKESAEMIDQLIKASQE